MILEGSVNLRFGYAAGQVASACLEALRGGRTLLGARCADCGHTTFPARSLCPSCGERVDALVDVGPEGTLVGWTELPERGAYGLVQLDGADGAAVHRLLGPRESWRTGVRVRASFADERTGSILDLAGFEVTE